MSKIALKRKNNKSLTPEELSQLTKDELVDKIQQLQAHNLQLKNIISKGLQTEDDNYQIRKKSFNFTDCHFRRVLLRITYFGWDYQGLAVQEDTSRTIEHHLFGALTKSCLIESRETSQYHRCGRTDKGVSSFGQVISINLRSKFAKDDQILTGNIRNELPYCKILNRLLPEDIRAICWMPIPAEKPEYSARFDCKRRLYKYYFPEGNLNMAAMNEACIYLIGTHDFRNLCKMDVGNGVTEFIRDIISAEVLPVERKTGNNGTTMHYLRIEGNAFLWHQIRCIFGVLLLIGQGLESPDVIKELLNVDSNPRKPQYNLALDMPLNLFQCHFDLEDTNSWIYDVDELKTVITQMQSFWTIHNIKSTMIEDCLHSLEEIYDKVREKGVVDMQTDVKERDSIMSHANCLLQGVKPKLYKRLLERDTCSSLEEKIEHYRKKGRLTDDLVT